MPTREELIVSGMPIVDKLTRKLKRRTPPSVDRDELWAAGVRGLYAAADRFDARRASFAAFAYPHVQGAMLDYLRAVDHMPRNARANWKRVERTEQRLMHRLGRRPDVAELASASGLTIEALAELRTRAEFPRSLDAIVGYRDDGEPIRFAERFSDPRAIDPAAITDDVPDLQQLVGLYLRERELLIVILRYWEGWTLKQISERLDLSESRVSQMHSETLATLRRALGKATADAAHAT